MTQEATPVGGEAAPVSPTEVFEQLARETFNIQDDEPQDNPPAEEEQAEPESLEEAEDEPQVEEEADDLPPIDAPVSWDAEAKELFKSLPREAQEIVAKREGEREKFVQQKSQEATRARQDAIQSATSELAQIEQSYAQQFEQLAAQLQPKAPDPSLLRVNPEAFFAQEAEYRATLAQQQQLQQQSQQFAQQAKAREAQAEQAFHAEQHRIIVEHFPEYADPTTGPEQQRRLSAVAKELGYPDELIGQARAADILAMRKAAEWKAGYDQLQKLNKQKMEKVRAAKALPKVASPGVAQGADAVRARNAQNSLEVAKSTKNREVQGAAFYDYLKANGHI